MSLFHGRRDICFIKRLNEELLNEIIDTTVDIFKYSLYDTQENIYGEALNKVYFPKVRLAGLVDHNDPTSPMAGDLGIQDREQDATFSFLKITLQAINLRLEIGDTIYWDNKYFEINNLIENQYIGGKNEDTDPDAGDYGGSLSYICECNLTSRNVTNLERVRIGNSNRNHYRDGLYG